jgi:hypothetical protein
MRKNEFIDIACGLKYYLTVIIYVYQVSLVKYPNVVL